MIPSKKGDSVRHFVAVGMHIVDMSSGEEPYDAEDRGYVFGIYSTEDGRWEIGVTERHGGGDIPAEDLRHYVLYSDFCAEDIKALAIL